jgi:hypothetical protein
MVGGIVEYQNDRLMGVSFDQQFFQKGDKAFCVFPLHLKISNVIRAPVVSTNDIQIFAFATESRNGFLLSALHPAIRDGVVQT